MFFGRRRRRAADVPCPCVTLGSTATAVDDADKRGGDERDLFCTLPFVTSEIRARQRASERRCSRTVGRLFRLLRHSGSPSFLPSFLGYRWLRRPHSPYRTASPNAVLFILQPHLIRVSTLTHSLGDRRVVDCGKIGQSLQLTL